MTEAPIEVARAELIAICEAASVPVAKWRDRDTAEAQQQVGQCGMLLRAGCPYTVTQGGRTLWVRVTYPGFGTFDHDAPHECASFYLPTRARLATQAGKDWY